MVKVVPLPVRISPCGAQLYCMHFHCVFVDQPETSGICSLHNMASSWQSNRNIRFYSLDRVPPAALLLRAAMHIAGYSLDGISPSHSCGRLVTGAACHGWNMTWSRKRMNLVCTIITDLLGTQSACYYNAYLWYIIDAYIYIHNICMYIHTCIICMYTPTI